MTARWLVAAKWNAAAMLLALFAAMAAPDHWPTFFHFGTGGAHAGHTHTHGEPAGDDHRSAHARHCHGDTASCSDVPFTGLSGLALLAAAVAAPGLFTIGRRVIRSESAFRPWNVKPALQPPRRAIPA